MKEDVIVNALDLLIAYENTASKTLLAVSFRL